MSDLFTFRVVGVDGATMRVHAQSVHPDQPDIPCTRNFALQIVVDGYWMLRQGFTRGPDVSAHPRRSELEARLAEMHGERVELTKAQYDALATSQDFVPGWSSWGVERIDDVERYHATRPTAYDAFRRAAETAIVTVTLDGERNRQGPDAEATVVATFSDPALLTHLARDVSWASAIYDFTGW